MDNYSNCMCDEDMMGTLNSNIGRIVTIFTQSGGASGCGFTGILVKSDCDCVKLITTPPRAPIHPFGVNSYNSRNLYGNMGMSRSSCNPFGTVAIIPTSKIVSYVCNEI